MSAVYAQLVFALDRAAELGHPTSLEELRAGGMAGNAPRRRCRAQLDRD
jgi:hypothetical protein